MLAVGARRMLPPSRLRGGRVTEPPRTTGDLSAGRTSAAERSAVPGGRDPRRRADTRTSAARL